MALLEAAAPAVLMWGVFMLVAPWVSPSNPRVRRVAFAICALLLLRYAAWRLLVSLPALDWTFTSIVSWTFAALEGYGIYLALLHWSSLSKTRHRSNEADEHQGWFASGKAPLLDVFIPTYNEDELLLRKTIAAAQNLSYDNFRVWILDDTRRDWLRALCEELGVRYLRRADNRHFKAGNLNNALSWVSGLPDPPEFVAVLDADFIVKPTFASRTMSLMYDPKVAIVQTPQHFYNPDPFQTAFGARDFWPDDQRFLFDVQLASADAAGAAQCCGTSFIARVSHLREIGGFATESICEDTLTSMKLGSRGYRTVYLNEALSYGLNANGLAEYLKQRFRWCLGTMQCMRSEWGPYRKQRGLVAAFKNRTLWIRWGYLTMLRFLWLGIPGIYLLTGFSPIVTTFEGALSYMLPLFFCKLVTSWVGEGRYVPIAADAGLLLNGFGVVPGTFAGVFASGGRAFSVTGKEMSREQTVVHWRPLLTLGAAALLTAAGLIHSALSAYGGRQASHLLWIYYWAYYSLIVLSMAMVPCVEFPRRRTEERFRLTRPARATVVGLAGDFSVSDVSMSGIRISGAGRLDVGSDVRVHFADLELHARVVRSRGNEHGLAWRLIGTDYARLTVQVFCTDICVLCRGSWNAWRVIVATTKAIFT